MLNNIILSHYDSLLSYSKSLWFDGRPIKDETKKDIFLTAFIHKSYAADFVPPLSHNERLEFLGDSILGACVWSLLYTNYPQWSEAQMTLYKIALVREENLAQVARTIELWTHIFLSNGEEKQWGRDKDAILSDTLEALIGAHYLIYGFDEILRFIKDYIFPEIITLMETNCKSYKSLLQEWAQWHGLPIPSYITIEEKSTENTTLFVSQVYLNDNILIGTWHGKNKKKAQEQAAEQAYKKREEITLS